MAYKVDDNGNITLYQGDSGEYTVTGIEVMTETDWHTYFAIQDENRKPVGNEIQSLVSNGISTFNITASLTDNLAVPNDQETATYYFGVKLVNTVTGQEDTLILANGEFGSLNTITVYPRKVKGA